MRCERESVRRGEDSDCRLGINESVVSLVSHSLILGRSSRTEVPRLLETTVTELEFHRPWHGWCPLPIQSR